MRNVFVYLLIVALFPAVLFGQRDDWSDLWCGHRPERRRGAEREGNRHQHGYGNSHQREHEREWILLHPQS